jgi:hypothetical protein
MCRGVVCTPAPTGICVEWPFIDMFRVFGTASSSSTGEHAGRGAASVDCNAAAKALSCGLFDFKRSA